VRINTWVASFLIIISCLSYSSCGSGGGASPTPPASSTSFLPLMKGISTTLKDDSLISVNDNSRTKGIVVESGTDGVTINGGFTVSSGTYSELIVNEKLFLQEQGGSVVLSRYGTSMDDIGGNSPANSAIDFNPPIVILQNKDAINVGDIYTTEHVSVTYSGNIYNHRYIPSQTDVRAPLTDATVTVSVDEVKDITIAGKTVTAYQLILIDMNQMPAIFKENPFFTNMFSWSWTTFWLAKGVGIVGVTADGFATSTTATIP